MSGSSALILAAYHPGQFSYAGSLSGFLNLSDGVWPTLVGSRMRDAGGFDASAMWGPGGGPAWQRNDPTVNAARLAEQRHSHLGLLRQRHARRARRDTDLPGQAAGEHHPGQQQELPEGQYLAAGGSNGTFNFPANGTHGWGYWGSQLAAMKGDIQRTLGA